MAAAALPLALAAGALLWRGAADQRELLARLGRSWGRTTHIGQEALSQQTWRGHRQLIADKAKALETEFETIRRAVQLEGLMAQRLLAEPPPVSELDAYEANELSARMADLDDPFSRDEHGKADYVIYRLSPGVPLEKAKGALDRLKGMGAFFAHNHRALPWCKSSYVWHRDGVMVGYPGGAAFPADYDPLKRYWLRKALQKKRLIWTKMYKDKDDKIVITYAQPLKGPSGIEAVAAVDIRIDDLLRRLFDLQGVPVADALLIDFKGRVRASASYGDTMKLNLGDTLQDKPPKASEILGRDFDPVFKALRASGEPSGVLGADGKPVTGLETEGYLYTFARVSVLMSDERSMDWYYLVRTPVAPILKPVGDIRTAFAGVERELSASIAAQQRRRALQLVLAAAAVILLAGGLSYLGARATARPLARVAEAVQKVAAGDFDQRLEVTSFDEIGQVQSAVNGMAAELKRGVYVQETFKRYVAPWVVDQLLKSPDGVRLGGERRSMSVLFSDLAGFTSVSEDKSPEALVELINEYLSAMTLCIFARDGTIDKYNGDAIMAFWGAPLEQPDHSTRACLAALDLFTALKGLHGKWRKVGLPLLKMRVGVNSGPMVVGNMGSMVKMDYSVLGDSVNLGSRLEGANSHYGTSILVGEEAFAGARAAVEAREVDLLAVKGKKNAVRVYELLGRKGEVEPARLAAYRRFEEGLALYRARGWDAARTLFVEADAALGGDPVSRVFLARLDDRRGRPTAGWDGSFALLEK